MALIKLHDGKIRYVGGSLLRSLVPLAILATASYYYSTRLPVSAPSEITTAASIGPSGSGSCLPVYDEERGFVPVDVEQSCLMDYGMSNYLFILKHALMGLPMAGSTHGGLVTQQCGTVEPYNAATRDSGDDWPPSGYTMIGGKRLDNLRCAIQEVNRKRIAGAIVELGVWRGGAMIYAAAVNKEDAVMERDVYLFDAFGLIPAYGVIDKFLSTSISVVQEAFAFFNLNGTNIHYETGLFADSLPRWKDSRAPIAVLRIDGNFYDSYQDALYYLYDKVPVGGIVIFDDVMSHKAVMECWIDFKQDQGLVENLVRIDRHSAWFRKEKAIAVDWNKFRPPRDVNVKKQ